LNTDFAKKFPDGMGSNMADLETRPSSREGHDFTFTADYIAYHAAINPSGLAVINNNKNFTYADFHQHLGRLIYAVRKFELEVGDTVAVEWTSLYPHWLLLLAFETLGIVTYSYTRQEAGEHEDMLAAADLVVCAEGHTAPAANRVQVMSKQWFHDVFADEPETDFQRLTISPDTPIFTYFTSGTTGEAKRIIQVARVHEDRLYKSQIRANFNKHSRFLVRATFSLPSIYMSATACLRTGGACVYNSSEILAQAISLHEVTHVTVVPSDLTNMLDTLPSNFVKPNNLTIFTIGGPVSDHLRERANRDLGATLIQNYSASEVFPVCTINPDGVGIVFPGVEAEVVDENHHPLLGQSGLIRVKSGSCVDGYEDNPSATAAKFRDGWFYPGDVGVMLDPRSLKLLGRADDLINIGGHKINPTHIEEQLRSVISAEDFCVTALPDSDGNGKLCVALVLKPSESLEKVAKIAISAIAPHLGGVDFFKVQLIPRTTTGKAKRGELKTLISELQTSSAAS
jgi:2,3-dihydroxybenzoate-AMP ligase